MKKDREMKGSVELIELEIKDNSTTDDASNSNDSVPESARMSKATWLAAVALGMSLTTAIQQQASTASIVKHIDAALGKGRKAHLVNHVLNLRYLKVRQRIITGLYLATALQLPLYFLWPAEYQT
jgi:hypothetical protein